MYYIVMQSSCPGRCNKTNQLCIHKQVCLHKP